VLFGLLLDHGVAEAAVISSAAFGLWHVVPTFETARVNRALSGSIRFWAVAAGAVVAFGAGLLFVWLRVLTGGLAAPRHACGGELVGHSGSVSCVTRSQIV
jgi:membrane protease YdiL (CAAX protease family)